MNKNWPKVVVGTLTWNQKRDVLECLQSVVRLDYPNFETVVVDNGSTDGTMEAVREQFPQVHYVRHLENLGAAEGVNGYVRFALQAGARYLFIVANDALVEPAALSELVRAAEKDPKIGLVFPKVYYYGSNKKIWFANGARIKDTDWLRGRFVGFAQNVDDDGSFDEEREAELYPGGFCMVRLEAVIKGGGFLDPGYFIYYEDADWMLQIHRAGFSGRYVPAARTWHKPSSSVGMETESFYYYRTRNRFYYFRKYAPRGIFPFFAVYYLYEQLLRAIPALLRAGKKAQVRGILLGLFDAARGKRGGRAFDRQQSQRFKKTCRRIFKRLIRKPVSDFFRALRFSIKHSLKIDPNILVHVDWNVGDEIMMIPAYEVLKKRYPQSKISAQVRYPELLKGNPFVDFVAGGAEQSFDPDLVCDLHYDPRGKSRLGYLAEALKSPSLPYPKVYLQKEEVEAARKKWLPENPDLVIAVCYSSSRWFVRQWERQKWIQLVSHFIEQCGARVLVLGKDEEPIPVGINLIGKTGVREAAALLGACHLFVGSDSGLVHLAAAVGTPTVGLYGPLNPGYLIAGRPGFTPIWSTVECRGCWSDGRMKHLDHCPKIVPDCMSSIPVSEVIEAAQQLLSKRGMAAPHGL